MDCGKVKNKKTGTPHWQLQDLTRAEKHASGHKTTLRLSMSALKSIQTNVLCDSAVSHLNLLSFFIFLTCTGSKFISFPFIQGFHNISAALAVTFYPVRQSRELGRKSILRE